MPTQTPPQKKRKDQRMPMHTIPQKQLFQTPSEILVRRGGGGVYIKWNGPFLHIWFYVYDFVSFVNSDRTRLSQNPSLTVKVPFCKTRTFQASYFNRIVKLWNTTCKILPPSSFSSLSTFKCSIKLMYHNLNTQIFDVDQPCTWTLVRGCSCHTT